MLVVFVLFRLGVLVVGSLRADVFSVLSSFVVSFSSVLAYVCSRFWRVWFWLLFGGVLWVAVVLFN